MKNNDTVTVLMIAFSLFFVYGLVSLLFLFLYIVPVANFFLLTLFILLNPFKGLLLLYQSGPGIDMQYHLMHNLQIQSNQKHRKK